MALLLAVLWLGYELHQIHDDMPAGMSYDTRRAIEGIEKDTDAIRKHLNAR